MWCCCRRRLWRLLTFHLWLVQKHGNAVPPSEEAKPPCDRKAIPFFPNFLVRDFGVWLLAFNVLSLLALMYPWGLGPQADPLKPAPLGIHPEWYFMSSFQMLKVFGAWFPGTAGEMVGMARVHPRAGLVAVGALVRWIDRLRARAVRAAWFGLFVLAVLLATTIWGYAALSY